MQAGDWLFSSNIQINFPALISLSRKLETHFSPSLQSSACPVLPLPVASLGCKHLRHSLSTWCVCVTPWPVVTCPHLCPICRGYCSVIAPSCWPGFPPQAAENPAFIALLVPVSTLVLAKMASAIFVQSRTKLAPITARNVMAIKIRRKTKSESPAWEAWLCHKSLMEVCIICPASSSFPASFLPAFLLPLSALRCAYRNSLPVPLMLSDTSSSPAPSDGQLLLCLLSQPYPFSRAECRCWFSHWEWLRKGICQSTLVQCQALSGHSNFPLKAVCQEGQTRWTGEEKKNGSSSC